MWLKDSYLLSFQRLRWPRKLFLRSTVPLDGRQEEIMKIRDKDDKAEMAAVVFERRAQSSADKQIRNDICLLGLITTSMAVRFTERGWTDYVNIQRHIMLAEKRIDRACLSKNPSRTRIEHRIELKR